ncbi:hypothetical protein R1flu_007782 [Riccia fluitans]|uniref:Uncharacterized protein n=1 Tax=Riccia fluitans TaxID=41844 RepID=A0ABD1YZU6_9MARC
MYGETSMDMKRRTLAPMQSRMDEDKTTDQLERAYESGASRVETAYVRMRMLVQHSERSCGAGLVRGMSHANGNDDESARPSKEIM